VKARIGVIGTGWWSTAAHLPALIGNPDADLVGIADLRPEVLRKAADHYGIGTTYTDYRELLDGHELDGAVVAVWHAAHYEVACAVLERGLHLLLEKPMVLRATDARELIRLAERRDRQIIMSYPWQFIDMSLRVHDVVAGGSLGRIHYVSNTFSSEPLYLYRGDDRADDPSMAAAYPVVGPGDVYSDPERSGGGQGHLQITHSAALMFFLTGGRAAQVTAMMNHLDVAVDVADAIAVRMEDGCLATVGSTGGVTHAAGKLDLQLYGTEGWIDLDYIDGAGTIYHADGTVERLTCDSAAYAGQPGSDCPGAGASYPAHLPSVNLVDVILGRDRNRSPGTWGWRSVELLDAAYRSAGRDGQPVSIASLYDDSQGAHR
jgi:predicted dehydrogenase